MVQKYTKDGMVAVLYSPEYGAGWSTGASGDTDFLVFDQGLVTLAMAKAPETDVETYLRALGMEPPYMGGWANIEVKWLSEGTEFIIDEYDGFETITLKDDIAFHQA